MTRVYILLYCNERCLNGHAPTGCKTINWQTSLSGSHRDSAADLNALAANSYTDYTDGAGSQLAIQNMLTISAEAIRVIPLCLY